MYYIRDRDSNDFLRKFAVNTSDFEKIHLNHNQIIFLDESKSSTKFRSFGYRFEIFYAIQRLVKMNTLETKKFGVHSNKHIK